MKLSIIIVCYNDGALVLNLLDSVLSHTFLREYEIIMVDNASRDGSADMVAKSHPDVKIMRNEINKGFPTAVNEGIKASRGEYVLLLNPDIRVKERAIDILIEFMDSHPRAGAVGGKIINTDGSIQLSGKSFPDPMVMLFVTFDLHRIFPNNPVTKKYYHSLEDYGKTHEVEHLMASFLMVRRSVIDKVGLMDEHFFLYCDDVDWCYRIHNAGYEIWYVPSSEVTHAKGATTSRESYRGIVEYHKSAWYFYKKYYYDKYPKALSALFFVGLWMRKWWYLLANFMSTEKKVKY